MLLFWDLEISKTKDAKSISKALYEFILNQQVETKKISYYIPYKAEKQNDVRYISNKGNNSLLNDVYYTTKKV